MEQRLVEVDDGVRLAVYRTGTGSPPVICLNAAGGAYAEWADMVDRLSPHAQIVTYGRPALGGSDPLPTHLAGHLQTIGWAAAQLRTLLQNAAIPGPYVLLTSSIGSWIADQYAAIWPDDVAGLVLIDPTNLSQWPRIDPEPPIVDGNDESGCIRLGWEASYAELARSIPPNQLRCVVVSSSDGRWERSADPSQWHEPLTLAEVDQLWQAVQREWGKTLRPACRRRYRRPLRAPRSTRPRAHVVHAVLDAARHDLPVQLSAADVAAVGGQLRQDRNVIVRLGPRRARQPRPGKSSRQR